VRTNPIGEKGFCHYGLVADGVGGGLASVRVRGVVDDVLRVTLEKSFKKDWLQRGKLFKFCMGVVRFEGNHYLRDQVP